MLGSSDCSNVMVYMESVIWFDFIVTTMEPGKALQRDFAAFLYASVWCCLWCLNQIEYNIPEFQIWGVPLFPEL